ncbi:MAG: hypothetical protein LKJ94_05740 [Candidatus Methanomethylophilus sp.]|jgi:hypothetical protein|nr:hypothetical protein [Methanomethylophilus sp.]MCI2092524.1 hypothetical protein [Methanomethylophilus sp.]
MKYEMWADGALTRAFSSIDDGHAIVRGYGLTSGEEAVLYAVVDSVRVRTAVYRRGKEGYGYIPEIPGIESMPPETLEIINRCSDLRRRLIDEMVGQGNIIESEYLDGAHGRKAAQKVLYKGKIFTFTVACGCRQFAAADPEDVHRLGIPQDLTRAVP